MYRSSSIGALYMACAPKLIQKRGAHKHGWNRLKLCYWFCNGIAAFPQAHMNGMTLFYAIAINKYKFVLRIHRCCQLCVTPFSTLFPQKLMHKRGARKCGKIVFGLAGGSLSSSIAVHNQQHCIVRASTHLHVFFTISSGCSADFSK